MYVVKNPENIFNNADNRAENNIIPIKKMKLLNTTPTHKKDCTLKITFIRNANGKNVIENPKKAIKPDIPP
ncbi:hypothetical protein IJD44_06590 [bacterium]|nr:hypothetical protein [bacterium]